MLMEGQISQKSTIDTRSQQSGSESNSPKIERSKNFVQYSSVCNNSFEKMPINPSYQIQIGQYVYYSEDIIGKTAQSSVYKGVNQEDDSQIAIKIISNEVITKNPLTAQLHNNEVNIQRHLDHQNILKIQKVFSSPEKTYLVTEYCNEGDLFSIIEKRKGLKEITAIKILRHLVIAFCYLNSKNIQHRDLKAANILVNNGIPKICDFGFCIEQKQEVLKYNYMVGTPEYTDPQYLRNNLYSQNSDIWSLGIIFYEMLYGKKPWTGKNQQELIKNIFTQPLTFHPSKHISDQSRDFLEKCLQVNPTKRFSVNEMPKHILMHVKL